MKTTEIADPEKANITPDSNHRIGQYFSPYYWLKHVGYFGPNALGEALRRKITKLLLEKKQLTQSPILQELPDKIFGENPAN